MMNKKYVFFIIAMFLCLFVVFKSLEKRIDHNIKMSIIKQNNSISNIDQKQDGYSKIFYIDKIDFQDTTELVHSKLGSFGLTENFFIQFESAFQVLESGWYKFIVYSDDGFRLFIDNKAISEFRDIRPFSGTEEKIFLNKGLHSLNLFFFQGEGNVGIKAFYMPIKQQEINFIGDSTKYINFKIKKI
ncbi:MAG: hypothetical protein V2B14_01030 [bacterium]